jgi:hypothetical protein
VGSRRLTAKGPLTRPSALNFAALQADRQIAKIKIRQSKADTLSGPSSTIAWTPAKLPAPFPEPIYYCATGEEIPL